MINFDDNMAMMDPRNGFVLSTEDPPHEPEPILVTSTTMFHEEEKKEEEKKEDEASKPQPTMISTKGSKMDDMVSSRVGTNNPAFSRMAIEQRHLLIAQEMNQQFAEQIAGAEVNEPKIAKKPLRGALFGT